MKHKKSSIALLVIVAVGGFVVALDIYERRKLALPGGVVTLDEFSVTMPKPEKVIAFQRSGSSYFEVIGRPRRGFLSVPSGPPAYIFDSRGQIAYWTIDVGDSPQYWEDWQSRSNNRELSMAEALREVHH